MTSTDPKDREVESSLYAALRNREREIEELKEEIKVLREVAEDFAHEKKTLIRERERERDREDELRVTHDALRSARKEILELHEKISRLVEEAEVLRAERDAAIEDCDGLAAQWRAKTYKRLTQDKYEPPRVAREFARYNWTAHGMMRENPGASHGDWVWCSVADILAFEDERAGMIARIEVLEQQDRKLRADKIVMPRYMSVTDPRLTVANTHRAQGFNSCIAAWFKLNPSVEVTVEPEEKQL